MIPVGDSAPRSSRPWVNYSLLLFTTLVFLYELMLSQRGLDDLIRSFGVTPDRISAALAGNPRVPSSVYVTLLTSVFLHAGWLHLGSNMLFLWVFGDNVEDHVGHFRYLIFYLVCGTAAALAQVFVAPTSTVPLIGASGAIAGVLGAYLLFYPGAWVTVLVPVLIILIPLRVPVILVLGIWFVSQLVSGVATITSVSRATGGMAFWAHVGGFLFGIALALFLPKAGGRRRPRLPAGAWESSGGQTQAGWLRAIVSLASDALWILLGARILLRLFGPFDTTLIDVVSAVVALLTNPLVAPFIELVPVVSLDGAIVDLPAAVAVLSYQAILAAVVWIVTTIAVPPSRRYYRR